MIDQSLIDLAKHHGKSFGLDPALVCAVIEQESAWNPWAHRYEPEFFAKYVAPQYANNKISATEAYARGFSWGLMQLMGEVAREIGYTDPIPQLCLPDTGIYWGCKLLSQKLAKWNGDVTRGLLAWNGGGNQWYAEQVLKRVDKYKEQ